jgi:hypothetical protein
MGALQNPDYTGTRYALYVDELRELFASAGLTYGTPSDILWFNERLRTSAPFFDLLSSQIRLILFREGGSLPRAQLLEIFAVAIGGPEMEQPAQYFREPMRQLFAFITGTMRRPGSPLSGPRGAVVPFPSDVASAESADFSQRPSVTQPERRRPEPPESPTPLQGQAPTKLDDLPSRDSEARLSPPKPNAAPSIRNLILIGAAVVLLAILLVLMLRPHSQAPADSHAIPAYTPPPIRHAKPSPYGAVLSPTQRPPRRHRVPVQPTTVAGTTQSAAPESAQPAAPAAQPTQ